ncbi:MAG TPA: hypothetical protein VGV61_11405 [Thermoanaerobaculia bacterium]|jgi:photosystem II stability/assembly factor-like uncharacterized protein|nr:hypothetical protein [Thermoanaerobaculia bacterium]
MSTRARLLVAPTLALALAATAAPPARAGNDAWTPVGLGDGRIVSLTASSRGELWVTATLGDLTEIWHRPSASSAWQWRNAGLGRPQVAAFVVHPLFPDVMWAASGVAPQRLFGSTDGGAHWTLLFPGDGTLRFTALWAAPTRRYTALFGETADGKILRSDNGGAFWVELPAASVPVAAAPAARGVVFTGARAGGLLRSTDGGLSFARLAVPVGADDQLLALHATYGKAPLVFASFRTGGLLRSTNLGKSWQRIARDVPHARASAITSDARDPARIYVADLFGVQMSAKGGRSGSFRDLTAPTWATFNFVPAPTAVAVGDDGPCFLSATQASSPVASDLLRAVQPVSPPPVDKKGIATFVVKELRLFPPDQRSIFVRREIGCRELCDPTFRDRRALLSHDGGITFARLGFQFFPHTFFDASDLACDAERPQRCLDAVAGMLRLLENGVPQPSVTGSGTVTEIAAGGALLGASSEQGVARGIDDGQSWAITLASSVEASAEHPLGGTRNVVDLVADSSAPERVLARALESYAGEPVVANVPVFYLSGDSGASWKALSFGGAVPLDVELVPHTVGSMVALVDAGNPSSELRRSDDDGATWRALHTFPRVEQALDAAVDPTGAEDLYVATSHGVVRSRDGGVTWETAPGSLSAWGDYRQAIARVFAHPSEHGHVYAAPYDGGLFENRLSD